MFMTADILDSGGRFPDRAKQATAIQTANAHELCVRVNALFAELGIVHKPTITSGLRIVPGEGAQRSAHLEGMAVDFLDPGFAIAHRITRALLLKHRLRREDTDYTQQLDDDGLVEWCHVDMRPPYGKVFKI